MKPPLTYRPKSDSPNIGGYRYFFNGQEADNEVFEESINLSYEFRQYDSRLGRWRSMDPKWNEYPGICPYVFCGGNPIIMVDPKGGTPISAIIEGIGAFVISAGLDFLSNWLIEGQDYSTAFKQVSWGTATVDALSTFALSFFIDGTGSAKIAKKISASKIGKLVWEIVANMISSVIEQMESGKDFSTFNLQDELVIATFSALLNNQMSKKADELLTKVQESNEHLYNKCLKQKRNIAEGKNGARLNQDSNQVGIARDNANASSEKYALEKTKVNAVSSANKKITNELNEDE